MTRQRRLAGLLLLWADQREQDRTITAEELCAICPEHLKEMSRRIEVLEAIHGALQCRFRKGRSTPRCFDADLSVFRVWPKTQS
jgi:hypothetical protein